VAAATAEIPEAADIQGIVQALRRTPLHENHLADLRASGLDDETIRTAGLCSAPAAATRLLGFEFEMGLFPNVLDEARAKGIDIARKYIPAEVFDKRAVEKNQVVFHDVAAIEVKPHVEKNCVAVELTDFSVFYSQDSIARAEAAIKNKGSRNVVERGRIVKVITTGEIAHTTILDSAGVADDRSAIGKNYLAVNFKLDYVNSHGDISNYYPSETEGRGPWVALQPGRARPATQGLDQQADPGGRRGADRCPRVGFSQKP
jgi:hypothetical protein